ncbi:hypothetical protein SAY86_022981 [Trapa natans]|uniref:Uncharacterized protein n=1 Tax=Trapa natans TaxID=22666 RepID=A0AAN7M9N2_TRANT|nr:hypothetical protein SAY86_022981 [Trapa natans]
MQPRLWGDGFEALEVEKATRRMNAPVSHLGADAQFSKPQALSQRPLRPHCEPTSNRLWPEALTTRRSKAAETPNDAESAYEDLDEASWSQPICKDCRMGAGTVLMLLAFERVHGV